MNKLRMNMVKCDFVLKLSGSSCRPLLTCSSYPFSFFLYCSPLLTAFISLKLLPLIHVPRFVLSVKIANCMLQDNSFSPAVKAILFLL